MYVVEVKGVAMSVVKAAPPFLFGICCAITALLSRLVLPLPLLLPIVYNT